MARSRERFARLLTQGIYSIRVCESNKLISAVQDELGYALGREGGTAIEYWRKGRVPAEPSHVEKLAREIVRRSDLGREWLEQFLDSAGHPDALSLCDELFPPPPPSHIPGKTYRKLVGRDALIDDIVAALCDPAGRWIVTIDGMGGIGKTALAREVANRCWQDRHFAAMVWTGASRDGAVSEGSTRGSLLTFETVLDTIVRQLGTPDVSRFKLKEKETRVGELLRRQPALVVLDNLETAREPQNTIARRLWPLLNPSKAIMTSRHRFEGDLYRIHLTGLDGDRALEFIQQEADERRISRIGQAKPGELEQIVESTGGSPLAMKLVVGQLGHLPLEAVLEHLRKVRPIVGDTDEDAYIRFYKFIYFPSWELLSDGGKRLLISMSHFAPGVGGTFEAVKTVSNLAGSVLTRTIDELWRLSFLEVGESPSLNQVRYYLHALTQYFVLSDVVQVRETRTGDEKLSRVRQVDQA